MKAIERILVPVDFSPRAHAALEHAFLLARCLSAAVDVFHVWRPPRTGVPGIPICAVPAPGRTVWEWSQDQARRQLDELLEGFDLRRCAVSRTLVTGDPGQEILRAIAGRQPTLVVMGTHGRTGLARILGGSLAERIVRHAACPVLTVQLDKHHDRTAFAA